MRFVYIGSILLASLVATSCAFKKDSKQAMEKETSRQEPRSGGDVIASSEVGFEFLPQELFGQYKVRVTWPKKDLKFVLRYPVNYGAFSSEYNDDAIDASVVQSFDAINCSSGNVISIHILYSTASVPMDLNFPMACPKDKRVSGQINDLALVSDVTGRLFLDNGAILDLRDKKLDLNLIGLHVAGTATIESHRPFPKNDGTDDGKPDVRIRAKMATGALQLRLYGENGPDAKSGADKQKESAEYQARLKSNPVASGQNGSPGKSDLITRGGRGPDGPRFDEKCLQHPTNGTNGANGIVEGLAGDDGTTGGASSRAQIAVQDAMQFELSVFIKPGQPGKPGAGGPGQPGGAGGAAGASANRCNGASAGQPGKPAKDGAPGAEGKPGACGEISLSRNLVPSFRPLFEGQLSDNCHQRMFLKPLDI